MLSRIHLHARQRDGARVPLADWRRFGASRFRPYHILASCQGVVLVLAGFEVIIPFALQIGAPPALAMVLGTLPVAGGMAQLLVPRLLDRLDGNLRGVTVMVAGLAEARGLALAALVVGVAAGFIPPAAAVVFLALIVAIAGALGAVGTANLLAWHSAVLGEEERRLVVPRLMAVSMALGALMLVPVGLLLDHLSDHVGILAYAVPFGIAGVFGIIEVVALRRLPHPGRVIVPKPQAAGAAPESPELRSFLRATLVNALGMGFTPYVSVYAIAVLGLTAGFTMMLGALSMVSMVAAAAIGGAHLARGSSERMLRMSFAIRAGAMTVPILALPGSAFAPLLLCLTVVLAAVGFATGQLAANERLFRLISGPAVIRHHGRYLARTSGAITVGQLTTSSVLAVGGPIGYPAFAALFAISGGLRVVAFRLSSPARLPARRRPAPAEPLALAPGPLSGGH